MVLDRCAANFDSKCINTVAAIKAQSMTTRLASYKTPETFLLLAAFAMSFGFATWMTLLNNFVIEQAQFTGKEIGILQSLREVPGFLAFTAVFLLAFIREQRFAWVNLFVMGFGIAITGYFPTAIGLYVTTVLMSVGFHYYETVQQSLSLQWFEKETAASSLGRMVSSKSMAAVIAYLFIWSANAVFMIDYQTVYLVGGLMTMICALGCALLFPDFDQPHVQHKKIILRRRYWLYYALTFMSGARRQIFVVFAGFLMVEKFGYTVSAVATLYLVNHAISFYVAPKIGRFIERVGERRALTIEYIGLAVLFASYAVVDHSQLAAALYVIDHILFAMAIAIKTYFQKIADPKDISATAAVSFSINHIAAVVIPVVFGLIWLYSHSLVFLLGAAMALVSLTLSQFVPKKGAI